MALEFLTQSAQRRRGRKAMKSQNQLKVFARFASLRLICGVKKWRLTSGKCPLFEGKKFGEKT